MNRHKDTANAIAQARAIGRIGQHDVAVSLLRQLLAQQPENTTVARELSIAAARLRDYPLAIDSYSCYMRFIEPAAIDHIRFADLYLMARDVPNSRTHLETARGMGAETPDLHLLDARLSRLEGNYDGARNASEKVLADQPANGQAWSIRIETAPAQELRALIERIHAAKASATTPYHQGLLQYALGEAYAQLDEYKNAVGAWAAANQIQVVSLASQHQSYNFDEREAWTQNTIHHYKNKPTPAPVRTDRPKVIFIVGMPRSGTTLVERMLSQLDDVTALGENEAMGFIESQYQRDIASGTLPNPAAMTSQHWGRLADRYFELSRTPRAAFMTDKMPHNFTRVGLILAMFPNAPVIQMRRDPRDVCFSIYTRSFPDAHNYSCGFDSLAHAIKLANRLMDHWVKIAPDRVLDVNYESLVASPEVLGRQITEFCGLTWDDRCLFFHEDLTASFTFSEMQVREPINDQRIGRWRRAEEHLQPMLASLHKMGCIQHT